MSEQRTSNQVQCDLLDYVSFKNEPPPAAAFSSAKKYKNQKSKSLRGRGRPPSAGVSTLSLIDTCLNGGLENSIATVDGIVDAAEDGDLEVASPDGTPAADSDAARQPNESDINLSVLDSGSTPYVNLSEKHRLLGMWEGSFDIKSTKGSTSFAQ